jgi:hypothetical protein
MLVSTREIRRARQQASTAYFADDVFTHTKSLGVLYMLLYMLHIHQSVNLLLWLDQMSALTRSAFRRVGPRLKRHFFSPLEMSRRAD